MKRRASLCLLSLMATMLVVGPGLCLADEPPRDSDTVCQSDSLLLRLVAHVLPAWLVCAISDESDPVGSDLPRVSVDGEASSPTPLNDKNPVDVGDADRTSNPSVGRSGDNTQAARSEFTIVVKL